MQTSMRIDTTNRDALARIAAEELGGASLDETLRILLFEHRTRREMAQLVADAEAHADYLREAGALAEVDVAVTG